MDPFAPGSTLRDEMRTAPAHIAIEAYLAVYNGACASNPRTPWQRIDVFGRTWCSRESYTLCASCAEVRSAVVERNAHSRYQRCASLRPRRRYYSDDEMADSEEDDEPVDGFTDGVA